MKYPEQEKHDLVGPDRHAEIVSFLIRQVPNAWRVIFQPQFYIYDERDIRRAGVLEDRSADLRVRFQSETDWQAINEIIRRLLDFDARLCRMSIGVRIDGRNIYGESI